MIQRAHEKLLTPYRMRNRVRLLKSSGGIMARTRNLWLLGVLLFSASISQAGVNVNNGNFYIAYTDFFLPTPGLNVEITRTYNSRSNYAKGYFGMGWSSEMEGYLVFDKSTLVYFEGGGGNAVRFEPVKGKKGEWSNSIYGNQNIRQIKNGYVLRTPVAKDLQFDMKGRLAKISDRNRNYIEFVYKGVRPQMIKDNHNNQIKISWKDFGKFPRIVALERGEMKARYEYSPTGDLVKASGLDGNPFEYAWDDEHNLTKISYKDGTYREIAYNKVRDWVVKYRERDKWITDYEYISDTLDPENKFGTVVSRYKEGSKDKESSRYWYEFRRRADGSRYNYKAVTLANNLATESIFTECCNTPLVISQWNSNDPKRSDAPDAWITAKGQKRSTFFEYYADGLLKKKTAPDGAVTFLTYDPKNGKVASVSRAGRKVEYNYDVRGNLDWAYDSGDNKRIDLTYDLKGRITVVKEAINGAKASSRLVYFRYNAEGKPIEVKEKTSDGNQGSIQIAYDRNGEVLAITNSKGRAVASENEIATAQRVAMTFQNLMEIVQPAGVSLSPEG